MIDQRKLFLTLSAIAIFCIMDVVSDTSSTTPDRYSRQVYTLGARAHGEIRRSIIYVDGPMIKRDSEKCSYASGLMMECLKNLALSGVGEIILLQEDSEHEVSRKLRLLHEAYCDKIDFDDLGLSYLRAAIKECGEECQNEIIIEDVVAEYIRRLNPQVKVSLMRRHEFLDRSSLSCYEKEFQKCLISIDRPESTQSILSSRCRLDSKNEIKFVAVETQGFYGRIFCDFGKKYKVYDEDGELPKQTLVSSVELSPKGDDDNVYLVNCEDGEKHDVSKGDIVQFTSRDGIHLENELWRVEEIFNPYLFSSRKIGDYSTDLNDLSSSTVSRIKQPRTIPFLCLDDAFDIAKDDPRNDRVRIPDNYQLYTASDLSKSFDEGRRKIIMASFSAFSSFVRMYFRTPDFSEADVDNFTKIALNSGFLKSSGLNKIQESIMKSLLRSFCCGGKFVPIQSFFGALAAQEALKSVSGLYNPICQFLLFDCDELDFVTEDTVKEDSEGFLDSTPGQSSLLSKSFSASFASHRLFVVGSGAIGCELLKNLAAMGAGTFAQGAVILTDMDTIEHSNLSRQLLFRDSNVGELKSIAAKDAVARFNSALNLEAHTSKVGDKEDGPFNDNFWMNGVDIVLNALDNVDARLFIDSKCVENQKGMVDAGTLGAKGNVQVVVPMQSESYGSSVDPPEPAIPVCTLKNFPYDISHTIQWGRDLFDGLFNRRPTQAKGILSSIVSSDKDALASDLVRKLGEDAAEGVSFEIGEDLDPIWGAAIEKLDGLDKIQALSISWSIQLAYKLFVSAIDALLEKHPEDSLDEDGQPFWSGTRREPKKIWYSAEENESFQNDVNIQLIQFVRAASRLRAEMYIGSDHQYSTEIIPSLESVRDALEAFNPLGFEINNSDSDICMSRIKSNLDRASLNSRFSLSSVEFEKDDDQNDHVAFVSAASNLRAIIYGIKPVDAMETRQVAGKIVPAMITTTALVSALSCLELVKLICKVPLHKHNNAFVNLALPFFALTSPLPTKEFEGVDGTTYTLWDRLIVNEKRKAAKTGGMTLQKVLKKVQKASGAIVNSLSFGPYLIYADFLHDDDEELMLTPIWELVKDAVLSDDDILNEDEVDTATKDHEYQQVQAAAIDKKLYLEFSAVIEDEDGDEYELPRIRIIRYQHNN